MNLLKDESFIPNEHYYFCEEFTEEFKEYIEKTLEKLEPGYKKSQVSYYTYYFLKEDGDEISGEYDCCDNDECINKTREELEKEYPNLQTMYYDNDGDHENIERCYQCNKPLNEHLTWIEYELDHYHEYLNDPIPKNEQFDLYCILQSIPSCDCSISEYVKHQLKLGNKDPLNESIKETKEFYQKVKELIDKINNCKIL